jgi:hypothetical protein
VRLLRSSVLCLTVFWMSVGISHGAEKCVVTGARVNIRAVADPQGEIVGVVSKGTAVSATGVLKAGWVEIAPPPGVTVWLYGELVRDGEVAAVSVRVRSGPGIGYRPVGTLSKGTKVKALGTKGDWISIAPPPSCTVWISEKFVSGKHARLPVAAAPATPPVVVPAKQPIKRPAPKHREPLPVRSKQVRTPPMPSRPLNRRAVPAAQPVSVPLPVASPAVLPPVHDVPDSAPIGNVPESVRGLRLVRNAPQGKSIRVTGILRTSRFRLTLRPSRSRLMLRAGASEPAMIGCYVIGDASEIAANADDSVTLVGKKYWVQGVREPVVVVSGFYQ